MEKDQVVEVRIEDMSSEGQGIGRADGFVVFVPGAVIGDIAKVQLTKVKKNYGFSKLIEIVSESAERTDEFDCEFFENGCGGCQYGKIKYSAQLALKESQVRQKLHRIAAIESPRVRDIIGMEDGDNDGLGPFRYRNKAQFPVSTGGIITRKVGVVENLGDPAVGFFRAKSHAVVDCSDCYLQSQAAMAAADALRRFMAEDNITAWDPKWEKGLMRHIIVKTGFESGEVMVILVINGNGIPNVQKLVAMMDEAIYEAGYSLESVVLSIKKGEGLKKGSVKIKTPGKKKSENKLPKFNGSEIMGDKNVVIAGKNVIRDKIGKLEFEISPASFYQVNPVQMKRLYDKVREYCGFADEISVCGGEYDLEEHGGMDGGQARKPVILDLYCGVGSIGLYCADRAEFVIGIESVKDAVIDANRNAVVNGIVNARYICGKAEEVLTDYVAYDQRRRSSADEGNTVYKTELRADELMRITENKENGDYESTCGKREGDSNSGEDVFEMDPEIAALIKRSDIAIIDPPRAGCKPELLEAVAGMDIGRIVYVSCDPATLSRDIKLLAELGYEFVEATPVDMFPWTGHVETVCLLSKLHSAHHIEVELEMDELDLTAAESKATYEEIKDYVLKQSGLKVSNLYIAQVKQKCDIIERVNYNLPKSENSRQPKCPPEKEEAIIEALRYFKMI